LQEGQKALQDPTADFSNCNSQCIWP
jgi:hypothetical protein